MMEGELIAITIISSIFGLIGLYFLNHNKFKYKELKHEHDIDFMKEKNKIDGVRFKRKQTAIQAKQTKSPLSSISGLLDVAKNLDSDQLGALIDLATGESGEMQESGGLTQILENLPPELITNFVRGLNAKKQEPEEPTDFPGQM